MFLRLLSPLVLLLLAFTASAATFTAGGPVSTNNDDTCDIGLFPAATLLLPYFEVDITAAPGTGETTLFTVTNVGSREQVALVTLWTDLGYPAMSFSDFAEASNMVHIRAIPEGETADVRRAFPELYGSNFPRTFYGRFTGASKADGRQPLPSLFATRVIEGGPGDFESALGIWRQPATGSNASCSSYPAENITYATELVRFDEEENPVATYAELGPVNPPLPITLEFASTSRVPIHDDRLPQNDGDLGGWLYLNLDDPTTSGTMQGWVTATMRSEGRYSVGLDAIALGNGCTPAPGFTEISTSNTPLGPAPNVNA